VVESGAARLMRMRTSLGIVEGEGGGARGRDRYEVGAVDVFEVERRARVAATGWISAWLTSRFFMWRKKKPCEGVGPNMPGSGYLVSSSALNLGRIRGRAADVLHIDVELDVFDEVAGIPLRIDCSARGC